MIYGKNDKPNAARVGLLLAYLARRGVNSSIATQLVKLTKTNDENAESVRQWTNQLPKKP